MFNWAATLFNGILLGGMVGYYWASGNPSALFGVPIALMGTACVFAGRLAHRCGEEATR